MENENFTSLAFLGFPNYEISKSGVVKNKSTGKTLKSFRNRRGYLFNVLYDKNQNRKALFNHRLIALTFIPNPENKPQINHINGIKTDNRVENLEWVTNIENSHHAYSHGLHDSHLTLNENQVHEICKKIENLEPLSEIARDLNISYETVRHIKCRDAWNRISSKYKIPAVKHDLLNEQTVHEICKLLQEGMPPTQISKKLNVRVNRIEAIKCSSTWSHISKDYKNPKPKEHFISEQLVRKTCSLLENGMKISEISSKLNIPTYIVLNIKQGKAWLNISKEYKIPSKDAEYSKRQKLAHEICKCIENGMSNISIASRYKEPTETIRRIRNGIRWTNVSKLYNFSKKFNSPSDIPEKTIHEICHLLENCEQTPDILFKIAFECHVDVSIVNCIYNKTGYTEISQKYPNIWRKNDRV